MLRTVGETIGGVSTTVHLAYTGAEECVKHVAEIEHAVAATDQFAKGLDFTARTLQEASVKHAAESNSWSAWWHGTQKALKEQAMNEAAQSRAHAEAAQVHRSQIQAACADAQTWVSYANGAILALGVCNLAWGSYAASIATKRLDTLRKLHEKEAVVGLDLSRLVEMVELLKSQDKAMRENLAVIQSSAGESPEVQKTDLEGFLDRAKRFSASADHASTEAEKILDAIKKLKRETEETQTKALAATRRSVVCSGASAALIGVSYMVNPAGAAASSVVKTAGVAANVLAIAAHTGAALLEIKNVSECQSILATLGAWEDQVRGLAKDIERLQSNVEKLETTIDQLKADWASNVRILQEVWKEKQIAEANAKAEAEKDKQIAEVKAKVEAEMKAQMLAEMQAAQTQLQAGMQADMRAQMEAEVRAQMQAEMRAKMQAEMRAQLEAELRSQLETDLQI